MSPSTCRVEESALRVTRADGTLVFFAPVTSGSEHDPLPPGDWKVTSVGWHPVFHYNPDLFWDAKPRETKATIKPGPNNPVGVVWIESSLEHYGLHGTPEPSNIGHTESHGCVRLTNWDAARLAALVQAGNARAVSSDEAPPAARPRSGSRSSPALIVGCCVGARGRLAAARRTARRCPRAAAPRAAIRRPNRRCQSTAGALARRAAAVEPRAPPAARRRASSAQRDLRVPIDGMDVDALKGGFAERRGGGTRRTKPWTSSRRATRRCTPSKTARSRSCFQQGRRHHDLPVRSDRRFCYYYAHLERYADGMHDGQTVSRASHRLRRHVRQCAAQHAAPALRDLPADAAQHWWQGTAIDPYPRVPPRAPLASAGTRTTLSRRTDGRSARADAAGRASSVSSRSSP